MSDVEIYFGRKFIALPIQDRLGEFCLRCLQLSDSRFVQGFKRMLEHTVCNFDQTHDYSFARCFFMRLLLGSENAFAEREEMNSERSDK